MLSSEQISSSENVCVVEQEREASAVKLQRVLNVISDTESRRIIGISSVHATPISGKTLSIEDLTNVGIRPKYELSMDNRKMYLTGCIFPMDGDHIATTVFVQRFKDGEGPEEYVVRTFYRSNSQGGAWRYLPGVISREDENVWFSKGHHENSVTAPFELFQALCELRVVEGVHYSFPKETSCQLVQGTTHGIRGYSFLEDPNVTYVQQVRPKGITLQDSQCYYGLKPPQEVTIANPRDYPDFDTCLASVECEAPLFGDGVPDQVIIRRPNLKAPLIIDLERNTSRDSVQIATPSGLVCSFTKSGFFAQEFKLHSVYSESRELLFQASPNSHFSEIGGYVISQDFSRGTIFFSPNGRCLGVLESDGTHFDFVHGKMIVRHFYSRACQTAPEEKLLFTFHTDTRGRSMIGTIQKPTELTSLGIYKDWPESKSLLVPIYEYASQSGNYADYSDSPGHYVSMWKNYLSQVHVINDYTRRYVDKNTPPLEAFTPAAKNSSLERDVESNNVSTPAQLSELQAPKRRKKIEKAAELSIDGAIINLTLACEDEPNVSIRSDRSRMNYQYRLLKLLPCIPLEHDLLNNDGTLTTVQQGAARITFQERKSEDKDIFEVYLGALPKREVRVNGVALRSNRRLLLMRATKEKSDHSP